MRRIAIIAALVLIPCFTIRAEKSTPEIDKNESDVIINAFKTSVSGVTKLRGIDKSKNVGVLMIQDSGAENIEFSTVESGFEYTLQEIPVIGWFMTTQRTLWSVARFAEGTPAKAFGNTFSRNAVAEDLIISELVKEGYQVIETTYPYYGDINSIVTDGDILTSYAKRLGVDTIIVGSMGGSILKVVENQSYFYKEQYFVADTKLNLRSVDTKSNVILDSTTFSGVDSLLTHSEVKIGNIALSGGIVLAAILIFGVIM
jgi:hypothetical protein